MLHYWPPRGRRHSLCCGCGHSTHTELCPAAQQWSAAPHSHPHQHSLITPSQSYGAVQAMDVSVRCLATVSALVLQPRPAPRTAPRASTLAHHLRFPLALALDRLALPACSKWRFNFRNLFQIPLFINLLFLLKINTILVHSLLQWFNKNSFINVSACIDVIINNFVEVESSRNFSDANFGYSNIECEASDPGVNSC